METPGRSPLQVEAELITQFRDSMGSHRSPTILRCWAGDECVTGASSGSNHNLGEAGGKPHAEEDRVLFELEGPQDTVVAHVCPKPDAALHLI